MTSFEKTGIIILKWLGKKLSSTATLFNNCAVACLSLAETLLTMIGETPFIQDISNLKESLIEREAAKTEQEKAKAAKLLAEAAKAHNDANIHKRNDRIAEAETKKLELENAKTQAEIDSINAKTEIEISKAKAQLIEAIQKLRMEGGEIFVNSKNLQEIIQLGPPPAEQDEISNICELNISTKSRKALQAADINTIDELTQQTEGQLLAIKGFGQASLIEVKTVLSGLGYSLGGK